MKEVLLVFRLRNLQCLGVYQLRDTFRKEFPLDKDGNQGWQLKESIGFVHDLINVKLITMCLCLLS
jgi:hypothetical protein